MLIRATIIDILNKESENFSNYCLRSDVRDFSVPNPMIGNCLQKLLGKLCRVESGVDGCEHDAILLHHTRFCLDLGAKISRKTCLNQPLRSIADCPNRLQMHVGLSSCVNEATNFELGYKGIIRTASEDKSVEICGSATFESKLRSE